MRVLLRTAIKIQILRDRLLWRLELFYIHRTLIGEVNGDDKFCIDNIFHESSFHIFAFHFFSLPLSRGNRFRGFLTKQEWKNKTIWYNVFTLTLLFSFISSTLFAYTLFDVDIGSLVSAPASISNLKVVLFCIHFNVICGRSFLLWLFVGAAKKRKTQWQRRQTGIRMRMCLCSQKFVEIYGNHIIRIYARESESDGDWRGRVFGIYSLNTHISKCSFFCFVHMFTVVRWKTARIHGGTPFHADKIQELMGRWCCVHCSYSWVAHREAEITHWIVSSAEHGTKCVCTYFIRLCSGVLVLANCQENSRRFIYLCQFQTMLFLFLPLLSLCLFLWWSSSAASPSSLSSLVQWLCRIDSFLAHFLLCFLLQMPTFSWHHVWAWRSPLACIHSIWLAMRVIDTLVLFFFPVVRRLEVDCKNGFSTLRDWDLHSRQDLDRLAPHISGNVISIPRHSAE